MESFLNTSRNTSDSTEYDELSNKLSDTSTFQNFPPVVVDC